MTSIFKRRMGRIAVLACAMLAALATAGTGGALASDAPAYGGPGGAPYRFACPAQSYLIGFVASTGAWVDQLTIRCGRWNPDSQTTEEVPAPDVIIGARNKPRNNGGVCPSGYLTSAISIHLLRSDNHLLDNLALGCVRLGAPNQFVTVQINSEGADTRAPFEPFRGPDDQSTCAQGEFATGIHGRSGDAIDAIGLICAKAPMLGPIIKLGKIKVPASEDSSPADKLQNATKIDTANNVVLPSSAVIGKSSAPAETGGATPPSPAAPQLYKPPLTPSGKRLAWCLDLDDDNSCGRPAALGFCKQQGFVQASDFDDDKTKKPTETLGGAVCSKDKCKAFQHITCAN